MYHYLYLITNNINGKIYIGKHSTKNLDDGYMGSGKVLHLAFDKYGIENFTKTILRYVPTEDDLNDLERWIVDEEFINREDTYNLVVGGIGHSAGCNEGKHHTEETKKHLSEVHKGMVFTELHKKHMSEAKMGNQAMLGKHHSEETKKQMSESAKKRGGTNTGKHFSDETKKKMSAVQKGRIISEETKLHMSLARKGRHKVWNDESHTKYHYE